MKFLLYLGYRNGVPLGREAIAQSAPIAGELLIEDWREGHGMHRPLRLAQLKEPTYTAVKRDLHKPLFDPVIVRCTEKYMELTGFEVDVVDGQPVHYAQRWILRPVQDAPGA